MCRFYCCLAAHQRTKEMDSAGVPLLYPLDSNSSPWGIRCGGAYLLPRAWDNIGICIPVQVAYPQFRMLCSYLCSGLDCSRFSRFRWAYVFRFSLLVGWTVRACGYVGFLPKSFVGFALTAGRSIVWVENGMGYLLFSSLSYTNAFLQYGSAQPIW